MYKNNISLETRLKNIAGEDSTYGELWSTWNLNKKTLEPILSTIIKDYPHYSYHDHSHSESILLNIEKVLGNENIQMLSPTDLWLILHVAYLHDFGMVVLDTKIHEVWETAEFQEFLREQQESSNDELKHAANIIVLAGKDKEKFDISWALDIKAAVTLLTSGYLRNQHSEISREYILDIENIWGIDIGHNGLIKYRLVSLVAEISAMHTRPFEDIYLLHRETNGYKGDYAHPRLVASLLRLGDALDLDNGRFNQYGEKIFGEMPYDSRVHFGKHEATKHILINNETIEVEADCPTDDIYRETRRWYDTLKSEIEKMHLNWSDIATEEFSHPPKLVPYKILRNGVEDCNELSNLRFTILQKKAFEILEGSSIYKDKFSCIREIVQNAEDATKIQLWRDIKSGMYYSDKGISKEKVEKGTLTPWDIPEWIYEMYPISINIERNEENDAIVAISDRGTGISIDALKSICNVGQSYFQQSERKKEIDEMPMWLRPTANFGVGLQSCFMVTDKITIYTSPIKGESYKIIFKSGKQEGYVNVETVEDMTFRGSKVIIKVKNGINFSYNIFGFTAKQLAKVEPFESNCIVIYKLIESVFEECYSTFFKINVKSESIKFDSCILANISEENAFPDNDSENEYLYLLDKATKGKITFWYNNNIYKIAFNKASPGRVNVNFKGKNVKKNKISDRFFSGFDIEIDIYGLETKEALSLNREELSRSASDKIQSDIEELIRNYFDILIQNIETIKDDNNIVEVFLLTSWRFEKKFPDSLYSKISKRENLKVIKYRSSTQKYELGECSLHDIAKAIPEIYFIDKDVDENGFATEFALTMDDLLGAMNYSGVGKGEYECIIVDKNLKRFFDYAYYDMHCINCEKQINICKIKTDDNLYAPNSYTESYLIHELVYHESEPGQGLPVYIMRSAIPAFEKYEKLAVKLESIFFLRIIGRSKWLIISPISFDDAEKIKLHTKESFVQYVIERPVFKKLVQHVVAHGKSKVSKEDVVDTYKQLIGDFFESEVRNDREANYTQ